MPPLAFISHSAADRPTARSVAAGLTLRGVPCFLDVEHGQPGGSIFEMVNTELKRASHFLFIASPHSLAGGWPQGECAAAFGLAMKGNLVVIPCLLGIRPEDLPPLLQDKLAVDLADMAAALDRIAVNIPGARPVGVDITAVQQAFGAASRVLLGWPQETDGQWLERPELEHLHALATQAEPRLIVLLGPPGVGKSALLARLGNRLTADGVVLLALKADQLPKTIETVADIDREVGVPVVETLRGLAAERRVVLLIDQLDALSELMDQQSQRLSALLGLAQAVADMPNLQVILSSREFEYRNDVRLSTLKTEAVTLQSPPWEAVERFLVARKLDPSGWSGEAREVLRLPQHLSLFVAHLDGQEKPGFTSYHGLLEEVLDKVARDYGPRIVEAAEHIAAAMGEEEELSLGVARFRPWAEELRALEAAGLIAYPESRAKLSFSHQTLADYLRARVFVRDGQSLADFIRARQESLFVRPTLWTALAFLRTNSPATYRRQFAALWGQPGLRPHLRFLLIAFLGQLSDPDDQEAAWLLPLLDDGADPTLRRKALAAMVDSPGWFARLPPRLAGWMAAAPEEAWETVALLSKAMGFAGDSVLDRVERHWAARPETRQHALRILWDVKHWTPRAIALAERLAGDVDSGDVHHLILRVIEYLSQDQPAQAPQVLGRYLGACLTAIQTGRSSESMSDLLGHRGGWYGVDAIASRAPQAFLGAVWEWLLTMLEFFASPDSSIVNRYRPDHSMAFRGSRYSRLELPKAIATAVKMFAEQDADGFLAFVAANSRSDLMAVHHLLSLGLERIATIRPNAVLDYLLGDPRRLAIGEAGYAQDSERLITAVVPALSPWNALRLEQAIIAWPLYREILPDDDRETRRRRRTGTRQSRLRLLWAFPIESLSTKGRRHLTEEERALPNTSETPMGGGEGEMVASPMSAEQMAKASDDDIVGLFGELVDNTEWDHPIRPSTLEGGSIQASREFARFAASHPDRALRIIPRFQPGLQERPAGYALAELGKVATVAPQDLLASLHTLDTRGFASAEFRSSAARCLYDIARRVKGLDDTTCALLEGWLTDWTPPPPPDAEEEQLFPDNAPKEERTDSLLWDQNLGVLPNGNYPILDAMMLGLLLRDPPDANGWLTVLERHLERPEDPAVWTALAQHLGALESADRGRAFLARLFTLYPVVLQTPSGVRLVANTQRWLPSELWESVVADWLGGSWPQGPQAAGEVAALRLFRQPDDTAHLRRVEALIDGAELSPDRAAGARLGVTHVLVQAWREPPLRPLATTLLLRVLPLAEGAVVDTWMTVLSRPDSLPAEQPTQHLLEALLHHPHLLAGHPMGLLVQNLQSLLRAIWKPALICRVASALVDQVGGSLGDVRTSWAANAAELTEIALTLHRLKDTRGQGLDLFERLLAVNAFQIDQCLGSLDRRPLQ